MTIHAIIFYLLAALIVAATAVAVTSRHIVHAALVLVVSFFASAVLFYLLGAPLLAAFEVIIYAGAIMMVFLFIVMTLKIDTVQRAGARMWQYAAFGGIAVIFGLALLATAGGPQVLLPAATVAPAALGVHLFANHWLAVEIVSLLLLVALVGVIHLGRGTKAVSQEENP